MDAKRGAIIVGASLAALTAGLFLRRWYVAKQHGEEFNAAEELKNFEEKVSSTAKKAVKAAKKSTNGRAKLAT